MHFEGFTTANLNKRRFSGLTTAGEFLDEITMVKTDQLYCQAQ